MIRQATATLAVLLLAAAPAYAQQVGRSVSFSPVQLVQPERVVRQTIRQAAKSVRFDVAPGANATRAVSVKTPRASGLSRTKRGLLAAAAGVGGFFGGGFLGAAIEGNRCDCDDPGLLGFLIGAPIGAALAASLTWVWTR